MLMHVTTSFLHEHQVAMTLTKGPLNDGLSRLNLKDYSYCRRIYDRGSINNTTRQMVQYNLPLCGLVSYLVCRQNLDKNDYRRAIERGARLKKPERCPSNIYGLMLHCWAHE